MKATRPTVCGKDRCRRRGLAGYSEFTADFQPGARRDDGNARAEGAGYAQPQPGIHGEAHVEQFAERLREDVGHRHAAAFVAGVIHGQRAIVSRFLERFHNRFPVQVSLAACHAVRVADVEIYEPLVLPEGEEQILQTILTPGAGEQVPAGLDLEADPLDTATCLEQQSAAVKHWQAWPRPPERT